MDDLNKPTATCPRCRSRLLRVPRRAGDRLISLFVPVLRCRCAAGVCGWEGLVRRKAAGPALLGADDLYAERQVLEPSRGGRDGF